MRLLIATDAFPPVCGGSGWSTYELARGLRQRGHEIVVVRPIPEHTPPSPGYDGFEVTGFPASAPPVPFVRNYFRNERLYRRFAAFLEERIREDRIDLVHAQHVLTGPPAIRASRAARVPSICTVRDYWPMCYWGDSIRDPGPNGLCPGCSASSMTRCIRPHAGRAWPLVVPAIPYMRSNLALKQHDLGRADAIIAVSRKMASDLRARVPAAASARIETIPNAVDIARVRAAAGQLPRPMPGPYAVFVGKLAHNKGVGALIAAVERARLAIPLVAVGDGPERALVVDAVSRGVVDIRLPGWLDRDGVFQWLQHAEFMIFPSGWQEPLSRVLIEASALGVPTAAMDTGGTADIVTDEETGLLSRSVEELGEDVARLSADAGLRARLGAGARRQAELRFDLPVVIDRMERLYEDVVARFRQGESGL